MNLIESGSAPGLDRLRTVRLVPDNAREAGILAWLATRYKGDIRIVFDTGLHCDDKQYPMLWIGEPNRVDTTKETESLIPPPSQIKGREHTCSGPNDCPDVNSGG